MYIFRNLEAKINKFITCPEIIAIVGPRQSGKTTLLKHIYENYSQNSNFLTFEEPEILSLFEKSTNDFINLYVKNKQFLFIDEFQYSQNGGKILKQIYDTNKIKIFISGSSAIDLTIKALKYLVGRIFSFELLPFDFKEFLIARDANLYNSYTQFINIPLEELLKMNSLPFGEEIKIRLNNYFQEYTLYGGYPRVVIANDFEEKKEILKGIYSTLFLREIKDYLGLIDEYKLQTLIKALSLQTSNLIEYKELSSISEYCFPTLKKYLNFLEKTYISYFMRPFFHNKRKEIVKNPKIYFLDTGLRNYIVNDFRALDSRPDSGALLENAVFTNLYKKGLPLKYWRDKQGQEVDFITENNNIKIAIEVKLNINKCSQNSSLTTFLKTNADFQIIFYYYQGFQQEIKESTNNLIKLPCFV